MINLGFFLNVKNRFYWSHAWKTLDSSANSGVLIEDLPKSTFYSDQSDSDLLYRVHQISQTSTEWESDSMVHFFCN